MVINLINARCLKTKRGTRPSCETVKGVREDPTYVRSECPSLYVNRKKYTKNLANPHVYYFYCFAI